MNGESGIDLAGIAETASAVYVPESVTGRLVKLMGRKGVALRGLLGLLLEEYEEAVGAGWIVPSSKGKKVYQAEGLELTRMDFRPRNGDWSELTVLAHSIGYSRNYLFIRLLLWVLEREEVRRRGVPTELLKFLGRKLRKLVRFRFVETLVDGRKLGRKFEHDAGGGGKKSWSE